MGRRGRRIKNAWRYWCLHNHPEPLEEWARWAAVHRTEIGRLAAAWLRA